ncbi:MAG: hypothetical protein HGA25_04820 [Clostridiales bacterium]|nr:hypothetical protein [Clostridiales bacterium]
MRVAKENPSQDSYLRLATHYELGYPGDTPEGYAASIKKAEKYRKLSNNFN